MRFNLLGAIKSYKSHLITIKIPIIPKNPIYFQFFSPWNRGFLGLLLGFGEAVDRLFENWSSCLCMVTRGNHTSWLAGEKCVNCDEHDKMVIYWCFLYIKIWISTTILKRFLNGYHQQKLVGGFNPSENY